MPFRNGCNSIVRLGESAPDPGTRWYGGCRFGLAHGNGVYRMDWTIDGVSSSAASPVQMYYGRSQGPPKPGGSPKPDADSVTLARGAGHDIHEWEMVSNALDADVQAPNGKYESSILAMSTQADDVASTQDVVWIVKYDCSKYSSLEEDLAHQYLPLNRAQIAIIAPICRQALSRLKAERGGDAADQSSPFDYTNYGYYFLVYSSRDVTPRKGNDYDTSAAASTKNNIQLCPQPTTLAGCETLWRARQQPIRARRDALIANYDGYLAADYAARQAKFRLLEEALRAKVQAYAAEPRPAAAIVPADTPAPRKKKR
ncbi:MAG TPA: hypothetical protein VK474_11160 [Chthoniobacterales bacterium]|nr:hypothetical protein [Chthoniobacterales bacterium]